MSEIITTSNGRHRKGIRRSGKLSTRVDLTPMVDLGFLLITFFIFTTSMSQPKVMRLTMPDDSTDAGPTQAPAAMTFTFIVGSDHDIYYYNGIFNGELSRTNFNKTDIRTAIQRKMKEVEDRFQDKRKTIVLIKLTNESLYNDIVNALDEMLINGVAKYMLLDADVNELAAIEKSMVQ
jgi:biopolymer transport protein ExbD